MRVRDFFSRKPRFTMPRPPVVQVSPEETGPKNGRLTLVVVGALLLMVALALLNVRLIQDPSIARKAFGPLMTTRPEPEQSCVQPSRTGEGKGYVPPEVTFHTRLTTQEEHSPEPERKPPEPPPSKTREQKVSAKNWAVEAKKAGSNREDRIAELEACRPVQPLRPVGEPTLPEPQVGAKTYMVQVGAFSHPRIAQQWASKWKQKGYDVTLKPVARPNSGVTYRLYLGKFSSQQEADELAQRLKSKEGISAFGLMVRN